MQNISDFLSGLLANGSSSDAGLSAGQLLTAILIAYLGGVISSLTPCVYPMIPITLSVVGGMSPTNRPTTRAAWIQVFTRAGFYIGGMTVIYSFLGVAAGLTGKVFGSFTNTSGWYIGLSIILSLSALIMMDVIPFDPITLWERIKRSFGKTGAHVPAHTKESTALGAFVLGAGSGFIAAPCTTPVLTSILAYIAKTQSIPMGMALMTAFSLGLGTLLLVIAAFAGAIQVLPRSGHWMKMVKLASGLILLAFAQYLVFKAGQLAGN